MKPASFEYHAPDTVDDVCALLAEYGDDAKLLAGGQSLIPMLALRLTRFPHLVDLGRVRGLRSLTSECGELVIKAMATQSDLGSADETGAIPLLARAIPHIGHVQIRNRGTIGGSLAHADPAAELPAVALALDAVMEVASRNGRRTIEAADFFCDTWTTSLEPDEVMTAVRFPKWGARCGFALEEVARRTGDFALTGVVCGLEMNNATITRASVAMFGMGSTPLRASEAERALVGLTPSPGAVLEIAELAAGSTKPPDDVHASSRYRQVVGARVLARALTRALEEAGRG